jgi:hypothetical protein
LLDCGLCLARKLLSVILNDQSVMDMLFLLQDSCVDVLVAFLSLLKFFLLSFHLFFNSYYQKKVHRAEFIVQILCICPFDNLYVIHLKSSVKEFLAAPLPAFFLPYFFLKSTSSKLISIQYFRYLALCKSFVQI